MNKYNNSDLELPKEFTFPYPWRDIPELNPEQDIDHLLICLINLWPQFHHLFNINFSSWTDFEKKRLIINLQNYLGVI